MEELAIGIIATLLSTLIIGLYGILIIGPYNTHQDIYKKILRLIRNYEDPRKYDGKLIPSFLMTKSIEKQIQAIEEIIDLIEEQRDLHKILYKVFNYRKVIDLCSQLFEYIRNPVMLKEQKQFEDSYRLDNDKLFKDLKKIASFPWLKFSMIAISLLILLISVILLAFKFVIST